MENSVATSFPIYTTITYKGVVRYVDEYCIWADCRCNYFDRAYNDYGRLSTINGVGAYGSVSFSVSGVSLQTF